MLASGRSGSRLLHDHTRHSLLSHAHRLESLHRRRRRQLEVHVVLRKLDRLDHDEILPVDRGVRGRFLFSLLGLDILSLSPPSLPLCPLPCILQSLPLEIRVRRLLDQSLDQPRWRLHDFLIRLHHTVIVSVQRVGRSQKVKLVVSPLSYRQGGEERSTASSVEEGGESENVEVVSGDSWQVDHELCRLRLVPSQRCLVLLDRLLLSRRCRRRGPCSHCLCVLGHPLLHVLVVLMKRVILLHERKLGI